MDRDAGFNGNAWDFGKWLAGEEEEKLGKKKQEYEEDEEERGCWL